MNVQGLLAELKRHNVIDRDPTARYSVKTNRHARAKNMRLLADEPLRVIPRRYNDLVCPEGYWI